MAVFEQQQKLCHFKPDTATVEAQWVAIRTYSYVPPALHEPMTRRRFLRHNAIEAWRMQKTGWRRCPRLFADQSLLDISHVAGSARRRIPALSFVVPIRPHSEVHDRRSCRYFSTLNWQISCTSIWQYEYSVYILPVSGSSSLIILSKISSTLFSTSAWVT